MTRGNPNSLNVLRWLALILLLPPFMAGCKEQQNTYVAPPPHKVTVSRPEQRPVTDYLLLTGNTQAFESVDLRARVKGFLTSINFKDGEVVKKGKVLFVIERRPYEAKLELAEANLAAARAHLARATQEYKRQLYLIKRNATAQSEVEKWRAERDAAAAEVQQGQADVELARINLSYTEVRAPFDGRIDRHLVDAGNLVGAGEATQLATITRLDPIYTYFNLNERDLIRIMARNRKEGKENGEGRNVPVDLGIAGEKGYPTVGKLDFASTSVNPGTGTLLLRGIFDNPLRGDVPKLLPGMFVRIRIPYERRNKALLVPDRALGVDQGGHYVLVVNSQNVVEQRSVTIGQLIGPMRVINEGLQGNEWVVVNGLQFARPGVKVAPEQQTAENAAGAGPAAPPKTSATQSPSKS